MHAKKSHVIEATTKKYRWLLIFLLPCDFAITVALMTQPQKASDNTFEEAEDLNLAAVRLATSSGTALLSLISLFLVLPRFKFVITRRMIAVFALRIVSVILLVPELAYPNTLRTTLNVMVLFFIFVELIVVCIIFVKLSKVNRAFYGQKQRGNTVGLLLREAKQSTDRFLDNLDDWLLLKDSRKMLRRKYNIAQAGWTLACTSVFLIGFIIFVFEFTKIASTQKTLYSSEVIEEMNSATRISYFGNQTQFSNISQPRVLVVVLDGMRYDHMHVNKDMENLFTSPSVAPHSKIFKMNAQLPSMSVPNWMSILTGAPPEATGVLGNLLVPETKFDSMFREAANFNLNRGLTGSPWFSAIIDSTLPFLAGDGTIPTSLGAHGRETSDVADRERANVARHALTEQDYSLFLAHFSDIDIQGHCCGVTKEYNHHNTYYEATTNKSVLLSEMIEWMDEDTTMFVVADHGHVDRGGHGGTDSDLIEVPLIVYKKNSFIGNKTMRYNGPRFVPEINNFDDNEKVHYSNLDLAPTVCAILGVPVPRQTHGRFIDDAMLLVSNNTLNRAYYDLYQQKKDFLSAYIHTASIDTKYKAPELGPDASLDEYVKEVENIMKEREELRKKTLHKEQARNIAITAIICFAIAACLAFLLHSVTFCDPLSVFSLKHTLVRQQNRMAMLLGFLTTLGYYGLSVLIYFIAFVVVGYHHWDSTVIHYPQVLTRYAMLALVPAAIVVYLIIRGIHIFYTIMPSITSFRYMSPIFNPIFFGRNPILKDPGTVCLYRYYLSSWVVVSWLIFITMQASYTFIIPPLFAITYITPDLWVFRFRVITIQLMSLPLVITCIITLFFGFPSRNPNRPHFDRIYLLKISKDFRHANHPSALENIHEDVPMEDPILQKHKNAIFYSAILTEVSRHKFETVNTIYDVTSLSNDSINPLSSPSYSPPPFTPSSSSPTSASSSQGKHKIIKLKKLKKSKNEENNNAEQESVSTINVRDPYKVQEEEDDLEAENEV